MSEFNLARNENESFEAYKARRADMNAKTKALNAASRNGGKLNTRANRPGKGIVAYSYGNMIRAHFAKKRREDKNGNS